MSYSEYKHKALIFACRKLLKGCLMSMLGLISSQVIAQAVDDNHSSWDLGLGLTHYRIPDYNGSDNLTTITTPFPYIVYTGKFLRIKSGSVQAALFSSDRLFFGLSGDGTPPVDSDKNSARNNMPDLDPVLETGPSLEYYFLHGKNKNDKNQRLFLELPLRAAIATDLDSTQHIGWITNPRLKYHFQKGKWRFRLGTGPAYANDNYYQYYYGVAAAFATSTRSPYKAESGFGGMHYTFGFGWRNRNTYFGGYVRYVDLSHAEFENSPLVAKNHALLTGLSLAWIFNSRH